MPRAILTVLVAALLLPGCGDDTIETGPAGAGASDPSAGAGGAGPDLSTPESAVRAFCGAAATRDVRRMGACIAEDAGEDVLRRIAHGEALTPAETAQLPTLALGVVHGTRMGAGGAQAVVRVTFANGRNESILAVRTPGGWKVHDF